MKLKDFSFILAAATALTLITSSCKKTNDAPIDPPVVTTDVKLTADAKFGGIITDNTGRALYQFARDVAGTTSACSGGCAVTWPSFYKENPSVGTGLKATDFGVVTRADGNKQTTYKGWPLYYYVNDVATGDTKGDAIGNIWFVAKADYTVMIASAQLVGNDGVFYNDQGVAGTGNSQYLVDAMGRTLYTFKLDTRNTNMFTKPDLSNNTVWPMFEVTAVGSVPSILDKTQFATIIVAGKTQLVYKGYPLYWFGLDAAARGNTKGVSVPTPGAGTWKVINSTTVAL